MATQFPIRTRGPFRATYFPAHDIWDVDAPADQVHRDSDLPGDPTTPDSDRYSVLEDLKEGDALLFAEAPTMLEIAKEVLAAWAEGTDDLKRPLHLLQESIQRAEEGSPASILPPREKVL